MTSHRYVGHRQGIVGTGTGAARGMAGALRPTIFNRPSHARRQPAIPHGGAHGNTLGLVDTRRGLLTSFAGGALSLLGAGTASAAKQRERRNDRKHGDPHGADGQEAELPGSDSDGAPADAASETAGTTVRGGSLNIAGSAAVGAQGGSVPILRIDTRARVGSFDIAVVNRVADGSSYRDTLRISITEEVLDQLNPGVFVDVRPTNGLIWNGPKTYINRGNLGTFSFSYEVSITRGKAYEVRLRPFLEDVRAGSPSNGKWISENPPIFCIVAT